MVRSTEMLVLCKRRVNTVNIRLMTYSGVLRNVRDGNGMIHSLPTPNGWDAPFNLFGNTVPNFPIVFRDETRQGADKFANFEMDDVTTLYELIDVCNRMGIPRALRINKGQSLLVQFRQLKRLVSCSEEVAQMGVIDAMNEPTANVVVVTGKDLAILALFLLNVCMVTILITKCNKGTKSRGKKVSYEPVSVMSESELVSVQ